MPLAALLGLALVAGLLPACSSSCDEGHGASPDRARGAAPAVAAASAPTSAPASAPAHRRRQAQVWVEGDRVQVGYGAEVTLRAVTGPGVTGLKYRWEQASGPDVRASMRADGGTLRFETRPLRELVRPRRRFGPLPIAAHEVGEYTFRLYATGAGLYSVVPVAVRSAETDGEWPRAVPGRDRYFTCGGGPGPWRWAITKRPAASASAVLADATTCTPRFRPDVHGRYEITEQESRRRVSLDVGPWFGSRDCGRSECHPREYERWSRTPHATIAQRGLEGEIPGYTVACLRCHAVGAFEQNPAANGFDVALARSSFRFPEEPRPGSWERIPEKVRAVMGVGCDNCHGPGFYWTGWGVAACARCHDAPPRYVRFDEWRRSHAATADPLPKSQQVTDGSCTRCHTAQGFVEWARQERRRKRPWKHPVPPGAPEAYGHTLRDLAPQTPHSCLACHAPHPSTTRHRSLRALPPGTPYAWLGLGQVCAACHRQPPGLRDDQPPHPSLEADLVAGVIARPAGAKVIRSKHAGVPGGCVGCHMFRPASWRRGDPPVTRGGHTFRPVQDGPVCQGCHEEGPPPRLQLKARLAPLRQVLDAAIRRRTGAVTFDVREDRLVLLDPRGKARPLKDRDLRQAVYAYYLLRADRSQGMHNPLLVRQLLARLEAMR